MGLHSQDPDTIYVLPEDEALGDQVGGGKRYVTDAKMRVFVAGMPAKIGSR